LPLLDTAEGQKTRDARIAEKKLVVKASVLDAAQEAKDWNAKILILIHEMEHVFYVEKFKPDHASKTEERFVYAKQLRVYHWMQQNYMYSNLGMDTIEELTVKVYVDQYYDDYREYGYNVDEQ
jgi:hypothetical protein